MAAHDALQVLHVLCKQQMQQAMVDIAKVSIALGAVETPLTNKDSSLRQLPDNLQAEIGENAGLFENFVLELSNQIAATQLTDARAKAKLVADAVWSKLTGVFVNDVLHVQHVYTFTQHLKYGKKRSKRQLDCGGVVTTVLAACQILAQNFGHSDLDQCRFQVSEDHCWLNIDAQGRREGTIEVTTDNAPKRALPVDVAAWQGWLYSGGHAPLCSPQMTVVALITSMNPTITPRSTGEDSSQVQQIQHSLLSMIQDEFPEMMYPAALGCLADLTEVQMQDALQQAVEAKDAEKLHQQLQADQAQKLFKLAIQRSMQPGLGGHHQFYPYSYLFGHLMRRAEFLIDEAAALIGTEVAHHSANAAMADAMQSIAAPAGSQVLRQYRYANTDEQLYKDLEGVLEQACDMLAWQRQQIQTSITDATHIMPLLEYWDGVCHLFAGRAKPAHWVTRLLKTLRLCSVEARTQAAAQADVSSEVMLKARLLWAELKGPQVKALFEVADIADTVSQQAAPKRQRREATHKMDVNGA